MKLFFGYSKYYSVTSMLLELGLPSYDILIFNSHVILSHQCQCTDQVMLSCLCACMCVGLRFERTQAIHQL